jgi:hypothetical protein
MWIKSKYGLFNADNFERFESAGRTTFGYSVGSSVPKPISDTNTLDEISRALQNNQDFLEVE